MSQREESLDALGFYDELGADYDLMVSWKQRLEREAGFLRRMRHESGAASVLDVACGTGMHAITLAREGMRCAAADISPHMIARARQNAAAADAAVDFRVAAFGKLRQAFPGTFDLVTCLGNSLPHLLDDDSLREALRDLAQVLSPGGLLVIQNRNYDRLLTEGARFMPVTARAHGADETLFLRLTDIRSGDPEHVDFTIVTLRKREGAWSQSIRSTPLRALRRRLLEESLLQAGFSGIRVWGGYDGSPFDETGSLDLVIAARTAGPRP